MWADGEQKAKADGRRKPAAAGIAGGAANVIVAVGAVAALVWLFRYDADVGGDGVYRLDRWRGEIVRCSLPYEAIQRVAEMRPANMECGD